MGASTSIAVVRVLRGVVVSVDAGCVPWLVAVGGWSRRASGDFVMLPFVVWRDLAVAFVCIVAVQVGWSVRSVEVARSGTAYVKLARDAVKLRVRLADHVARGRSDREFHVRQRSTGRLRGLRTWLRSWE